jgi:putative ABC transport system permease protein
MVADNFFTFLGVDPQLGRHFTREEDTPGGPHVVVLSDRVWERRYGGDPAIVGKTVRLGGEPREVVGVLPSSFRLLLPPEAFRLKDSDVWVPTQIDPSKAPPRNFTGYTAFARMRKGVTLARAQEEMERLEAQLKEEHLVHAQANLQVRAVPLHGDIVKRARSSLYVLFAAVGLVLLIACGNTAQLLLARWRSGERELSIRAAMGASRWRLTRMVLFESLLLSLAGGGLGLLLAHGGLELVRRLGEESVPRLQSVEIDTPVLVFAVVASLASALCFGLIPALSVSRSNIAAAVHEASRGSGSLRQARARNMLLVAEIALSVMLLVGTGLMVRSFRALVEVNPGFQPKGVLTLRLSLPQSQFESREEQRFFAEELLNRLRALPGTVSVAATSQLPLTGSGPLQPFAYDEETAHNWESVTADQRWITKGYLDTLGATLLSGRDFAEADLDSNQRRMIIDESLAEIAFPGVDAVGRQLRIQPFGSENPLGTVVGVVGHMRLHDLTKPLLPQIYWPFSPGLNYIVVLRTTADARSLATPVREVIRAASPGAAIEEMVLMDDLVSHARAQARLSLVLMVAFGVFAVLLASVGLFGVISYAVSTRKVELGIRIALGASPARIRKKVLVEGATLVLAGIPLGFLGASVLARLMASLLYGVAPFDPVTYAGVTVTLGAVALLACWAPARSATRVDPVEALRAE